MISDRPLHHLIWEREIEKLEAFSECIVQFIGCEDEFWRLFDKADLWKKIFACRIWDRFSVLCDHQVRYLNALSRCLDIKLLRDFFRQINVFETFLAPLMSQLVGTNFNEPFEEWSNSSKLAFAIIYKFHTLDFEAQLEENYNQLIKLISEKPAMNEVWRPNQAHNEQKLCETIQIYWQLFCTSSEELIQLKIKRSIVECDDCIPLHDMNCVTKIRQDNMVLIWTMPVSDDEELLRRMRPFIVNVCSPPVEEDLPTFINFVGFQNVVCSQNMARWLLQDRDIVKKWARLVVTYRPDGLSGWLSAIQLLQSILRLFLGRRPLEHQCLSDIDIQHHWSLVEERVMWFGEVYNEVVQEDPNWSLGSLIREPRYMNIQAVVMFSAILLYNGTLLERDQLDIIDGAVNQYNEIVVSRSALAEEYRNYLALLQLCLHKEICVRIMLLKNRRGCRDSLAWISHAYFTEDIVNYCAFRFLIPEVPRRIFQAAIHTIEVALLYKTQFRRKISTKFESKLKEVVESGSHNACIASIELNEFKRVKNLKRMRMKKSQKKMLKLKKQRNRLLKTKLVTVAT